MKVSQRGLDLIKKYEGFYTDAYLCPANVWTIGFGTTVYANGQKVKKGDKIAQSDALKLLEKQVNEHSSTIFNYVKIPLNQNQFDALASFQYNLGKHILSKDKSLTNYINNKDWNNASRVMKLYNKGGGKVLQGLVKRRNEEAELFITPIKTNGGEKVSYTYKKQHVSSSKFSIKCPHPMKPEFITVHNTYNDASAKNESSYHNSNNNQVSFHIAIDDVEAIEVVPLNRNAWHCGDGKGDGNMKSIGIEICYSKSGGTKYEKAEQNAIHLIAKMLHERKWGIDRIRSHQSWSKKYCPHRILDRKDGWKLFLNKIQIELNKLSSPTTSKGDDDLDFSSSTLKTNLEKTLDSASSRKQIIERAIKELGYNESWRTKKGVTDGDILSMSVSLALKNN